MIARGKPGISLLIALTIAVAPVAADTVKARDTIGSLADETFEVRPGRVIVDSSNKARDNYRAFLDLVSNDPELQAEAMRRLADLELEAGAACRQRRHGRVRCLRQCRRSFPCAARQVSGLWP